MKQCNVNFLSEAASFDLIAGVLRRIDTRAMLDGIGTSCPKSLRAIAPGVFGALDQRDPGRLRESVVIPPTQSRPWC
jgi:hypothetical protein